VNDKFTMRRVGRFRLKGRREPVSIYGLLGRGEETPMPEWAIAYAAALSAYELGDSSEAKLPFEEARQARPNGDEVSTYFLEVISSGNERGSLLANSEIPMVE